MEKMIRAALLTFLAVTPVAATAQFGGQGSNVDGMANGHGSYAGVGGGFDIQDMDGGHGSNVGMATGFGSRLVGQGAMPAAVVGGCGVTDMVSFNEVIAANPTPAQFQAVYSCVQLVLPAEGNNIKDVRTDNSRYVPRLDQFGRIVGGSFR